MVKGQRISSGNLTAAELKAKFRTRLEDELAIAVRDLAAPPQFRPSELGVGEFFIAAYEAILQVRADADLVPPEVLSQVAEGWSQQHHATLETMLEVRISPNAIQATRTICALQQMGASVCESAVHEVRECLLRGMIEAQRRVALFHHLLIQARGDAVACLLDNDLVFEARNS